jgi:hypothetical protein
MVPGLRAAVLMRCRCVIGAENRRPVFRGETVIMNDGVEEIAKGIQSIIKRAVKARTQMLSERLAAAERERDVLRDRLAKLLGELEREQRENRAMYIELRARIAALEAAIRFALHECVNDNDDCGLCFSCEKKLRSAVPEE